MKFIYSYTKNQ